MVNYKVPVCETHDEVLQNCEKIADTIKGITMGYPGVDLICFPEYSTQVRAPRKPCWHVMMRPEHDHMIKPHEAT